MPAASDAGREHAITAGLDVAAVLRASRRRRLLGAVAGGMVGSGLAGVAVAALNFWLSKPMAFVWWGFAVGVPLALLGALMIHRIGD